MCGNIYAASAWRLIRFMIWDSTVLVVWGAPWQGKTADRVPAIPDLPEGVYKILWEDVGRYSCWRRKDEMEDGGGGFFVVDGGRDHRGADEFV